MQRHTRILEKQYEILNNPNISSQLKTSDVFVYRHIGNSEHSANKILNELQVQSIDDLMKEVVPEDIRLSPKNRFKHNGKELKGIDSETLMLRRMQQLEKGNKINKTYIGQGYYGT